MSEQNPQECTQDGCCRPEQETPYPLGQIFVDISKEREHQLQRWGNEFDDKNTISQWQRYINEQLARGTAYYGDLNNNPRKALVNAATVAVAAIEAFDRNNGLPSEHYTVSELDCESTPDKCDKGEDCCQHEV